MASINVLHAGLPQTFNKHVKSTVSISVKHDKVKHNKTRCACIRLWRSLTVRKERQTDSWSSYGDHGRLGFQLFFTWHRMFEYSSNEKKMENITFTQEICLKTNEYEHFPWLSWAEYLTLDKSKSGKQRNSLSTLIGAGSPGKLLENLLLFKQNILFIPELFKKRCFWK